MFEPIKNKNEKLYERVVNQIRQKIMTGDLKPGDRLPPERELTDILNVSRSSVREAIKTLEVLGLVNVVHGQGVFIANKSQEKIIDLLKPFIFLRKDSIQNLFEIRKTLETQAVVWATERSTGEELDSMENLLNDIKGKLKENEIKEVDVKTHNNEFHYLIFAMSHNPILMRVMDIINEFINEIYDKTVEIPERVKKSVQEHEEIYRSIKNTNPDRARELMMKHLTVVEEEIEGFVEKE